MKPKKPPHVWIPMQEWEPGRFERWGCYQVFDTKREAQIATSGYGLPDDPPIVPRKFVMEEPKR